ncbi:MAG: hypothetical protein WAZ48_02950 [Lysobacteraceae bacterium]
MKGIKQHWKAVVLAIAVTSALGFGAAQAVGGTNPETGCPNKAGCKWGGGRYGCCQLP